MEPIGHSWFFGNIPPGKQAAAGSTQVQQAWLRVALALLCLGYLYLHGPFFEIYATAFLATAGLYFLYNLYIIYSIRRYPASSGRLLVSPILDVYIISFALVIDGGNISGLSLLYLAIIFGNAIRYGSMMMLYTQALCLAGLVGAAIVSLQQLQTNTIWSLLGFQVAALLLLPLYALALGRRHASAHNTQHEPEQVSFGLLDHGPMPMFAYHLDEHGAPRIIHTNAALQAISREPITRLIGAQVDTLALLEDGGIIVNECREALQQATHSPSRFYIRGHDASERVLNLMGEVSRMRWHSQWIGLCFLSDVTEHSRLPAYEDAFIAGIVHDLRNVLTGIIGQAEMLQMDLLDPALQQRLNPVIEAGERGADMTSRLLNLGMPTAAKETQAKDLRPPLEKMIGLVRLQMPEKVALTSHIDPELTAPGIQVSELEQIILNLIQNAYQAIPNAGTIDVRITADAPAGNKPSGIVIQVEDTGCGIASENLDKIFATFWSTRRQQGATGLGLAIVKQIVERHHGHIDVQSAPDQGSAFTVHLPAEPGTSSRRGPAAQPVAANEVSEAIHTRPWRILLVDDSPVVLKVHQAMLTRMGHRVTAVPDAQNALAYFEQSDADAFDLILTDYNMPGMDGLQMIRKLRDSGVRLPIMVITAYGEEERLQQLAALDAGIIHKPISYRALSVHIATIQTSQLRSPQSAQ